MNSDAYNKKFGILQNLLFAWVTLFPCAYIYFNVNIQFQVTIKIYGTRFCRYCYFLQFHFMPTAATTRKIQKKEKYRSKLSIRKSYFSFTRIQYTKCPYPVSDTLFLLTLGPPFLSNFMPIFILGSSNLWLRTHVVGVLLFMIYNHNVTKNCCVNDFIPL